MPSTPDLRGFAGSAINQGKWYAGIALAQGRSAALKGGGTVQTVSIKLTELLEEAPRPTVIALGAVDVAAEVLSRRAGEASRQVERIPTVTTMRSADEARERLARGQEEAVAAIAKAQEEAHAKLAQLRERLQAGGSALPKPASARAAGREVAQNYLHRARDAYSTVNARGQSRAAQLSEDDRLARIIASVDAAGEEVQARLRPFVSGFAERVETMLAQLGEPPVGEPAVAKPAVVKPAVVKPAVVKPAVVKPAVVKPAVVKPAVVKPAVVKPAVAKPKATSTGKTPARAPKPRTAAGPPAGDLGVEP